MQDEPCDCFFCNAMCPDCGSTDIHVWLSVEYQHDKKTGDQIDVSRSADRLNLNCYKCNNAFELSRLRSEDPEGDRRLEPLLDAFSDHLKLPFDTSVNCVRREAERKGGGLSGRQSTSKG